MFSLWFDSLPSPWRAAEASFSQILQIRIIFFGTYRITVTVRFSNLSSSMFRKKPLQNYRAACRIVTCAPHHSDGANELLARFHDLAITRSAGNTKLASHKRWARDYLEVTYAFDKFCLRLELNNSAQKNGSPLKIFCSFSFYSIFLLNICMTTGECKELKVLSEYRSAPASPSLRTRWLSRRLTFSRSRTCPNWKCGFNHHSTPSLNK